MAKTTVEELQEALGEVLKIYNIKLDESSKEGAKSTDFSEIINKTQSQIDDLSERAEAIYERTGMTREQLEVYAANPNNFTKEQWDALQKVRIACDRYKQDALQLLIPVLIQKWKNKNVKNNSIALPKKNIGARFKQSSTLFPTSSLQLI